MDGTAPEDLRVGTLHKYDSMLFVLPTNASPYQITFYGRAEALRQKSTIAEERGEEQCVAGPIVRVWRQIEKILKAASGTRWKMVFVSGWLINRHSLLVVATPMLQRSS